MTTESRSTPVTIATEEQLEFLDELRESGATNMFGAAPYVQRRFGVSHQEATAIVANWMRTFSQRHPQGDR